jgi:aspartate-semialdehyde dehydrogenase
MHIAILGVTGAVGRTMLQVLEQRALPVERLTLLASARSAGSRLAWRGQELSVQEPSEEVFRGVDYALFSAGAERSREWAPRAAEKGATVVDNSSAWRMDARVPLVVPEVNAPAVRERQLGIIANPNCSTIQMVLVLQALRQLAGLRRVVATTFQSVSGAGERGREALRRELAGQQAEDSPFARPIAANAVPQIGDFDADGWTGEEIKMISETRKILGMPELAVAATCVRVPVEVGHSIQVMAELEADATAEQLVYALHAFPGIRLAPDPAGFPTPREVAGRDEVFVGRLRLDPFLPRIVHAWVVADNLRKGAATNAVQIVEALLGE